MEISEFHGIENDIKSGMSAPEFLEKEPVGLVPGIEIRNLKKVFSTEKGLINWINMVHSSYYIVILFRSDARTSGNTSRIARTSATQGSHNLWDVQVFTCGLPHVILLWELLAIVHNPHDFILELNYVIFLTLFQTRIISLLWPNRQ